MLSSIDKEEHPKTFLVPPKKIRPLEQFLAYFLIYHMSSI